MNERITGLMEKADQADLPEDGVFLGEDYLGDIDPRRVAKFAELIVRECANLARHDAVRKMSGDDIAGMIEMHFGVEK